MFYGEFIEFPLKSTHKRKNELILIKFVTQLITHEIVVIALLEQYHTFSNKITVILNKFIKILNSVAIK